MAAAVHTCITISCDTCKFVFGETGNEPFHFNTVAEGNRHAQSAGWLISNDQAKCAHCLKVAECERFGHPWQAALDAHGALTGRFCTRCVAMEPLPTPENPASV